MKRGLDDLKAEAITPLRPNVSQVVVITNGKTIALPR